MTSDLSGGRLTEPFRASEFRDLELPWRSVHGADYFRPHRGVRTTFIPETLRERCETLALIMSPKQFFSHTTCAALWGLPFWYPHDDLHVSGLHPTRAMRRPGVVGHQSKVTRLNVVEVRGLRLADPLSTWCMLASMLPLDELIVIADALVLKPAFGDTRPRYYREDLAERAGVYRGPRHGVLESAWRQSRTGSESPMETRLRLLLVRAGLPEPILNRNVNRSDGMFLARPDQHWPEYRTIAEYDGAWHEATAEQRTHDAARLLRIQEDDWQHVKVVKEDLFDRPHETVARVAAALIAGGWKPPVGFPF
ncbi:hypothetical protein HQQ80_18015 [Microbacteriaceae bacterium VKM Ac-2855]|nr:hypothetical protein [Microbacteriaceae bacterium VKM Ac-2855]